MCTKKNKSILNQTNMMNCGMKCKVINDFGYRNITVQFEDGTIKENCSRASFYRGNIANPSLGRGFACSNKYSIVGKTKMMKCGMKCTVIEDNGQKDITVQFEDGTIKENCSRVSFNNGSLTNPKLGRGYAYSKKNSILGQSKMMKCGMKCTVIEDNGADDISVQFEDGTIVQHRIRHSFKVRSIVNPHIINISSVPQGLIFYFIREFYSDAIQNFRPDWLKNSVTNSNLELDIWIPSKKIGIEYDGVIWHKEETTRSRKKALLIEQRDEIEKIITVLERGALAHSSPKHINIYLNTTSDRKESNAFLLEIEDAINKILKYLGVNEKIHVDDAIIEKLFETNILRAYSQNLQKGINDLKTLRPDLVEEWDYEKNSFLPTDITCGSGRKVWWKCSKCGHSWTIEIQRRAKNGSGCPNCAQKMFISKRKKQIINLDTGKIYSSITQASQLTKINKNSISKCCNGSRKTAGGFRWEFKKDSH